MAGVQTMPSVQRFPLLSDSDLPEGRPVLQFHKTLSSEFTNPPNVNVQRDGANVETKDHNNRVTVFN